MKTVEEILAALQAILDGAEGRNLNDEEIDKYEALEKDLEATQKSEAVRTRNFAYNVVPAGTPRPGAVPQLDTIDKAFENYLRTGRENADLMELRNAQSEGIPSEGGYLVPDGFRQKLVERMKAFGGIANVVEEVITTNGAPLPWATLDDTENEDEAEVVDEGDTFTTGADLEFGQDSLGAYSYMAGGPNGLPLRVSRELIQDANQDVEGLVSRKLGERLARVQSRHLVRGTGIKQPQGIIHGLTGIEIADDTEGITYEDLLEFIHTVDPAYRETGCRWAFNDATLKSIRGIVDNNSRPIVKGANDSIAGSPGGETLLGYPVTIDQAFPDFVPTSNTINWGVFGDLSEGYVIRRVRQIELLVNPYSRMQHRQIEYSVWARMDAKQQNVNAYVALTGEQA